MMTDHEDVAPQQYVNVSMPNEYFYPVLINVLFHQGAPTDDLLTEDPWYFGTGFYYRIDGKDFLVTARHILSGRTWRENKLRDDHAVAPTHIRITVRGLPDEDGFDGAGLPTFAILLPLLDDLELPIWFEHPELRHDVDVAALPMTGLVNTDGFHYMPIEPESPSSRERLWVTQDVFVVGFPLGLQHGYLWPLWVRGTVASEPALPFDFKGEAYPMFLIDARTRSGQSGAPVFMLRRSFAEDVGDQPSPRTRFLGVYSGRANDEAATPKNPLPADLGFVWNPNLVDEICRGETRGSK
jgi:hypothetical protein